MSDSKTITIDREFLERQLDVGLEYMITSEGLTTHIWNNALMLPQNLEAPEPQSTDDAVMYSSCPCCHQAVMVEVGVVCQTCDAYHVVQGIWGTENEKLDATYEQEQDQARWNAAVTALVAAIYTADVANCPGERELRILATPIYKAMSEGPPKGNDDEPV